MFACCERYAVNGLAIEGLANWSMQSGHFLYVYGNRFRMRIPHDALQPDTLAAVVQEFVTRDGTDHSSVEQRVAAVMRQLVSGDVEIYFDPETETCNIVRV